MKVTIKDIAKKSGVSISTVSKIISGKYKYDNVKISDETVKRVLRIAKENDYEPDFGARLLSTGKTYTIGIYFPKTNGKGFSFNHYYAGLISSIEKEAVNNGYDILMINYGAYKNKFNTKRIDGLIIIEQDKKDKDLDYLLEEEKPFVIINNLMDENLDIYCVNIDNYVGIRRVVKHFKENNHQSLAYIGELTDDYQKEHKIRLEFFKDFMHQEGLTVNDDLFLLGQIPGVSDDIHEHYYDQLSGYKGMEHLMKNCNGKFTGVFCANDIIALGAMDYLYMQEKNVPKDISIIGFDNVDFAEHLMGGLTTIRQPLDVMGKKAFSLLLDQLNDKKNIPEKFVKIEPDLIKRNTVANLGTGTS